jgi:hypothetical protein
MQSQSSRTSRLGDVLTVVRKRQKQRLYPCDSQKKRKKSRKCDTWTFWVVTTGQYIYPVGTRVRTFKIVCEECSKYIGHNGDILEGIKTEVEDFASGSHDKYDVISPRHARNMDQEKLEESIKNGTTRISPRRGGVQP